MNTIKGMKFIYHYFRIQRKAKKQNVWPKNIEVSLAFPPKRVSGSEILLTRIAHSCVLIQTQGLNIITDPIFSKIAGPKNIIGVHRVHKLGIPLYALPPIDYVLLSHNHFDHWDQRSLKFLIKKWNPTIVTPKGWRNHILTKRLPLHTHVFMNYGDIISINSTQSIYFEPAYHWAGRTLGSDPFSSLYGSYVLVFGNKKIYFAGDTAYRSGNIFHSIHDKHGDMDISILPIGAFKGHPYQHTTPKEAMFIHFILQSKLSFAIHYGSYRLSIEKYDEAVNLLKTLPELRYSNHPFFEFPIGEIQKIYL